MRMAIRKHSNIGVFIKSGTLSQKLRGDNTMENNQQVDRSRILSEPLLTASDVAYRLHLSRSRAYNLMQTGNIPTVRIGKSRRVRLQDLEAYIMQNIYSSEKNNY
jgi:excisionase family DNA binding protein